MSDLKVIVSTKNFPAYELECSCCGRPNPNDEFLVLMRLVQELRTWYGKPMTVTSAYRCPRHPIESGKVDKGRKVGQHARAAIDIQIPSEDTHKVVKKAFELGFTGIGINLIGDRGSRFIHLDVRDRSPALWSY